ncbi:MAG: trypsin-like peptidase domain-containing protein, partial [Bryobacteraceae bacterium]|nr:trypsin-like peptidase domain-containing protein [Bryobacteraceae bacterium]
TTRSTLRREDNLRVTTADGNTVPATIAGHDPGTDVAVLRFEGESAARGELAAIPKPGELALAVGRSANTGPNVSLGVVSAIGKPWQTWQGGKIDAYIRLDVNLYPGVSGAAVVNTAGALIGVVSGVLSRIAPLAIPSATIERVVAQLLSRGTVTRPWLGVGVQSVAQGLVVLTADPETPAGKAGIIVGDILVSIGGAVVRDPMDLRNVLSQHASGDSVAVSLIRGGESRELPVILGERPARSRQ